MTYKILNDLNMPLTINNGSHERTDAIFFFKEIFDIDLEKENISDIDFYHYEKRLSFDFEYDNLKVSLNINSFDKYETKIIFGLKYIEEKEVEKFINLINKLKFKYHKLNVNFEKTYTEIDLIDINHMELKADVLGFEHSLMYFQKILTLKFFNKLFNYKIKENFFKKLIEKTPNDDFININEFMNLLNLSSTLNIKDFEELLSINYQK